MGQLSKRAERMFKGCGWDRVCTFVLSVFLWDDPDQDQWSEITRIVVYQMNGSILPLGGIFGSFNVLQYDPRDLRLLILIRIILIKHILWCFSYGMCWIVLSLSYYCGSVLFCLALHGEADLYRNVNMLIQSNPYNTETDRAIENGCSYKGRWILRKCKGFLSTRTKQTVCINEVSVKRGMIDCI